MTKMRQWSILTVVAVVIVFAAGWYLLVKPQKSKASDLRTQATTQQSDNQVLQGQIAQLQSEEKTLPQQQAALRKFTTQVPAETSEPTLIRQLSASANGSGVDLLSLTPGTVSPVAGSTSPVAAASVAAAGATPAAGTATAATSSLMQLPVSIAITGSYANIESFFQSLEHLPRALMVTNWSICPESTGDSSSGSGGSGSGAGCAAPTVPQGITLPAGTLGGTLNAVVYYASSAAPSTGSTLTAPSGSSTSTTTTPATTATTQPSTAATPDTTGASAPPAN